MSVVSTGSTLPTEAKVRLCREIAAEGLLGSDYYASIGDRYASLTNELPLAGSKVLRVGDDGTFALIAYLRARAPWLEDAIAVIEQQLKIQLWAGRPWLAWRPLCLAGPPGTGKSYLAKLISEFAGTGHATLDLGGVSDARVLEGTARGWNNAQPCWPAVVINQTKTANPVLVLEEIDKAGGSEQGGRPHAVLLTMFEAQTAATYWDKCLLATVDLSHCCWIMTCNDAGRLPQVLRSRVDVVTVRGPGKEHFETVLYAIIRDLAAVWGVQMSAMPELSAAAVSAMRVAFTTTGSVRRFRRQVETAIAATLSDGRRMAQ